MVYKKFALLRLALERPGCRCQGACFFLGHRPVAREICWPEPWPDLAPVRRIFRRRGRRIGPHFPTRALVGVTTSQTAPAGDATVGLPLKNPPPGLKPLHPAMGRLLLTYTQYLAVKIRGQPHRSGTAHFRTKRAFALFFLLFLKALRAPMPNPATMEVTWAGGPRSSNGPMPGRCGRTSKKPEARPSRRRLQRRGRNHQLIEPQVWIGGRPPVGRCFNIPRTIFPKFLTVHPAPFQHRGLSANPTLIWSWGCAGPTTNHRGHSFFAEPGPMATTGARR